MSSSDAQPPLSRRQARERERAAAAGAQPVTPPPTVAAPASQPEARRRPGSHVAPAPGAPAQSAAPSSAAERGASVGVSDVPPASATEIVPGTGGLTRRQLRQLRESEGQTVLPVPLQAPTPQSSDRTVQDVIGSVPTLDDDRADTPTGPQSGSTAPQAPVVPQLPSVRTQEDRPDPERTGVSSSGAEPTGGQSPAAQAPDTQSSVEPEASAAPGTPADQDAPAEPDAETVRLDQAAIAQATEADGSPDAIEPLSEAASHAEEPRRHRTTWAPHDDGAPVSTPAVAPSTPGVFPLSLDEDDTNEVPVQRSTPEPGAEAPRVPAAFQRPTEPKPVTTAFVPPSGHWSQQADDAHDAEVHDEETGTRRVAASNTNSIILPNSALADPTGALNATGEVILTGSIDLPASLSSTGSHRPIDGAEVDRLLEQQDEQPETDASPVRASRAVSSHTSTRQVVLAAAKPKESRTPVILAVTVGAVGVAAAAVIIVALVTTQAFGG